MSIITFSRQAGSYGREIAHLVAGRLGLPLYDRAALLDRYIASDIDDHTYNMLLDSHRFYDNIFRDNLTYKDYIKQCFLKLSEEEDCVILGFGSRHFLEEAKDCVHFRITGSFDIRVDRVARQRRIPREAAEDYVNMRDRRFQRFISSLFAVDSNQPALYDSVFNTDNISPDACCDAIYAIISDMQVRRHLAANHSFDSGDFIMDDIPDLKNPTEIEFANLLNRYQVEWRYEPKEYPVEWDENGQVITAFRPDFYLTKFNLYLELTTMEQKYVARKNKKARLAKELYGINVKIVYRRDFKAAMAHTAEDLTEQLRAVETLPTPKKIPIGE